MTEQGVPPWRDSALRDALGQVLPSRSGGTGSGRLLEVATTPLELDEVPAGYEYIHLPSIDGLTVEHEAADVVGLRFVLSEEPAASRAAAVASAWELLHSGGTLLVIDDFNPVPSTDVDWSADHLVRLILDVSGGAATLAEVVVLRSNEDEAEDENERYACVAVTRL